MEIRRHYIEVYEPEEYEGPKPIYATGVSLIGGPERSQAYLLELAEPLTVESDECKQIVVRPRHNDPIDRTLASPCTVVIHCVKSDHVLDADASYKYTDVVNWGIGKITPINDKSN